MPTPVVLDCDPGHDDAIAILLAAGAPEIDLRAITTVAANQTLDKVTLNARRICSAAGISVPIARGCARPLVRPLHVAEDIHGKSGMDGPAFGAISVDVVEDHAIDVMRAAMPATLVATGALTNVATYLTRYGTAAVREIVLMGGSTERGNTTPYAEFNMYVDPGAAQIVFDSGVPVTMIGLNVTHQALVTPSVVARLNDLGPLGRICGDLMTFFAATYREVFGFAAPPLHDPVERSRAGQPWWSCTGGGAGTERAGGRGTRRGPVLRPGDRGGDTAHVTALTTPR